MVNKMFSIYDFFGYLVPGVFITTNFYFIFKLNDVGDIKKFFEIIKNTSIENIFILVIIMYIFGHIVSYISSITIERYSIWTLGYPSRYLLGFKKNSYFKIKTNKTIRIIMRVICFMLLFPITIWDIILCHSSFKMSKIIAKPLDSELSCTIKKCICQNLQEKYQIFYFCQNGDIDFLRIIYHEIIEESPTHFSKIQNYVALYGFARSIAFALNISTYFFIINFKNINIKNIILIIIFSSFLSFLMYCSYNKFVRKYNLEILMAYLIKMKVKTQVGVCNKKC